MSIEEIILTLSYFGIILLMTSNGFTSFPSSQLLYVICGYFVAQGDLNVFLVVLFGASGHALGNILLYELSRRKGLDYILKFKLFPEEEIRKVQIVFNKHKIFYLTIGKLVNPIKIFLPIPAGIAKIHRGIFAITMLIMSAIWSIPFVSIGYLFGKSTDSIGWYAIIIMIIGLTVMYLFYKAMNSKEVLDELKKEDKKKLSKKATKK